MSVQTDSPPDGDRPAARPPPWWKRLIPLLLAVLLVAWVVRKLELRAFIAHLHNVNHAAFLGFVALFTVVNLAADSLATSFVYRLTVAPVSTRQFFLIRGASYLPSLLNHHVGQAWLAWYLSRAFRAPLARVAGATALVYATTFGSLFLFGATALLFDASPPSWLLPTLGVGTVSGVGYLGVIHLRPRALAGRGLLAPLFDVGVAGHLRAMAVRLPHLVVLFLGTWLPFRFFGVEIPPAAALAYVPVLMVVQALPITPQGVGTRDVFAQECFARFGAGDAAQQHAAVAAATLSFAAAIVLVQIGFSLALMARALRSLRDAPKA